MIGKFKELDLMIEGCGSQDEYLILLFYGHHHKGLKSIAATEGSKILTFRPGHRNVKAAFGGRLKTEHIPVNVFFVQVSRGRSKSSQAVSEWNGCALFIVYANHIDLSDPAENQFPKNWIEYCRVRNILGMRSSIFNFWTKEAGSVLGSLYGLDLRQWTQF
ncbi:hypothetical protein ONS95_007284 [Cadophora gregata]|uniref:uncharacterized protein n=1 Tax=Cadophora gregata TaxID=51156 RepID=UPI0026DAB513|nr:uncharacterized protein ONS95_007284 [Cadophora gregata]KAK0100837.1 hypothetical protein ONS95_007284 [Cadophora gregata]KAK0117171.1 hypothetical protein ONS96_013004 [Cadophora gregata f. sp. sojae]